MLITNILIIIILIILTAFFVATEFAIVKVRKSRIDQLAEDGNTNVQAVQRVLENLDGYLSACQLGITVTALGLGWLGEPTVERLLHPLFEWMNLPEGVNKTLSFAVAFFLVTFLHVVLGELAPKTFAIQKAEAISLIVAKPIIFFAKVMYPFIWLLNGSAILLTRMLGLKSAKEHEAVHSEDELRLLLSDSLEGGEINQSEYKYVTNIFEFDNRIAKEIMVPRTEITAFYEGTSLDECFEIMKNEKYTRYPIAKGDKDNIIGLVNFKEVLTGYISNKNASLHDFIRPIIQVIETIPIQDLLVQMQRERIHMAILVDEYGGTAGLVTVEDILEEIVGEIRDEFDFDEQPMIQKFDSSTTVLDGKVLISEVNDLFGLDLDDSELDTIGGWVLAEDVDADVGSVLPYENVTFEVMETEGHQIKKVKVTKKIIPQP
ncbi:hemolysin family protein [Massilibacterium senegalense]|uniref:hemolysin family protein n=1 Tax=Massilibacterium senegalense TaxID=1632858 RepID=UPI000780804B|nr:hemolysin family protein [Massilibacterium senegalense]